MSPLSWGAAHVACSLLWPVTGVQVSISSERSYWSVTSIVLGGGAFGKCPVIRPLLLSKQSLEPDGAQSVVLFLWGYSVADEKSGRG